MKVMTTSDGCVDLGWNEKQSLTHTQGRSARPRIAVIYAVCGERQQGAYSVEKLVAASANI
jgi:hypothetical protein